MWTTGSTRCHFPDTNIWRQSVNPLYAQWDATTAEIGFQPIATGHGTEWEGLRQSVPGSSSFLDGTSSASSFYAVGAQWNYFGGIAGPLLAGDPERSVNAVELSVRRYSTETGEFGCF